MSPILLAIHGAAGRMGQRLVTFASADQTFKLVAALESAKSPKLGEDAGTVAGVGPLGVKIGAKLETDVDVMIDFTTPDGAMAALDICLERRVPLMLATTGLHPEQVGRVQAASKEIPILWAPSTSLAVNLAMKLTDVAAAALADHPSGADVEILERHHRFKEDSPSGTALKFGEIVTARMGQSTARHGREGRPGARPHDEIGYHAIRTGDNPGEHTIVFGLLGETLEVTVKATSRDCYAHGALTAAKFLADKTMPGLYGMQDVLGL